MAKFAQQHEHTACSESSGPAPSSHTVHVNILQHPSCTARSLRPFSGYETKYFLQPTHTLSVLPQSRLQLHATLARVSRARDGARVSRAEERQTGSIEANNFRISDFLEQK